MTLLFEGFRLGLDRQMAMPAASLGAPLVAVEEGAKHVVAIRSNIPQAARAAVEAIPGVHAAHPLVSIPVIFKMGERRTPIQVMAYDPVHDPPRVLAPPPWTRTGKAPSPPRDRAGAPRLAAGRAIAGPREIVLDERLARLYAIHVGDAVELLERRVTVVGLSADTDVFFSPFAFVTYDEIIDLYLESDVPGAMGGAPLLSFLLIEPEPGADLGTVRRLIESRVRGVDVYSPAELSILDVAFGRQLFGAVLNLLVGIAWLAAVLAIGLVMYAAVIDRRRDFGLMKALGMVSSGLAAEVVLEAIVVCVLAFPVALLLARLAAAAIESLNPVYRIVPWDPAVIARGAAAALVAAVVGALIPIRRLRALEPDLVFRT